MTTKTPKSEDAGAEALAKIGAHLHAIEALMAQPECRSALGHGLARELHYPLATFRQRFPNSLPGAQRPLL